MSIRITTTQAIKAERKRYQRDILAQAVYAIETRLPPPCNHRKSPDLDSCHVCTKRRAIRAAVDAVLETGGQP